MRIFAGRYSIGEDRMQRGAPPACAKALNQVGQCRAQRTQITLKLVAVLLGTSGEGCSHSLHFRLQPRLVKTQYVVEHLLSVIINLFRVKRVIS